MLPDYRQLTELLQTECGLALDSESGWDSDSNPWVLFRPLGADPRNAFAVRVTVHWRRLIIEFELGNFAADLLRHMSLADENGRMLFSAILQNCHEAGADILLRVNGQDVAWASEEIWSDPWSRFRLELRKGGLELGAAEGRPDTEIILEWTGKFMAAIIAILPLDDEESSEFELQTGFPEGAKTTITVNRYERDRRNRAAAIAIHGARCKACEIDFGELYGPVADGYIEIHHVQPVSQLGPGYCIDPFRDLVPLCANCHAVVHRIDPPMPIERLSELLVSRRTKS